MNRKLFLEVAQLNALSKDQYILYIMICSYYILYTGPIDRFYQSCRTKEYTQILVYYI